MFDGGLKRLLEPTRHSIPSWLSEPGEAWGPFGFALAAAVSRVDLSSLVDGATVYIGEDGKVSVGAHVTQLAPAHIGLTATSKGIRFRLDAIGVSKNGVRDAVDWSLTLGRDGDELVMVLSDARSFDKELANEKLFRHLRDAVLEAITTPPRLHTVTGTAAALELLDTVASDAQLPVYTFDVPRSVSVGADAGRALDVAAAATLSTALIEHLTAEGAWPFIFATSDGGRQIACSSMTATRAAGIVMSIASDMVEKTDDVASLELLLARKDLLPATNGAPDSVASPSAHMLSARSRFIPHLVSGRSASDPGAVTASSLWPCASRVQEIRVGKMMFAKDIRLPFRVGADGTWRYTYGPSTRTDGGGPVPPRTLPSTFWALNAYRGGDPADGLWPVDIFVSPLSVQGRVSYVPSSDQLLTWLANVGSAFEAPVGAGGATVTLVDRAG